MPRHLTRPQQLKEINDSIFNHIFLPAFLPVSADCDFCIRSNRENEHVILENICEFFYSIDSSMILPIMSTLFDCFQRWSFVQNSRHLSASQLQTTIEQLPIGAFLPLYFYAQNTAILMEIDEKHPDQPLISSWQVSLPTETIVTSISPPIAIFPVKNYRIVDRTQLNCKVHCELLVDFMKNTIESTKSFRGNRQINDKREVPISHYVCQWWIQHFPGVTVDSHSTESIKFTKKYRDQVRSNDSLTPFRRSGLWMTIKVVLQTILIKSLGNLGTIIYKLLIAQYLTHLIYTRQTSGDKSLSSDLLVFCLRKIVRRMNKIDTLLSNIDVEDFHQWIETTKSHINQRIDEIFPKLDWQRSIRDDEQSTDQPAFNVDVNLNDPELFRHRFENLKEYLNLQPSMHRTTTVSTVNDDQEILNTEEFDFHSLTGRMKYTVGAALTRMELWIYSWTDQWLDQPVSLQKQPEKFQMLQLFYEDYQKFALAHYCRDKSQPDPIGYSRFILTSLTILCSMHEKLCQDKKFERLKFHRIDLPNVLELFEYLVLPTREEMIRAQRLYNYLNKFTNQPFPDLLTDIENENSFGVVFANQSTKMINTMKKIENQIEQDKTKKIEEVRHAKDKYHRLMHSINTLPCTCYRELERSCRRCRIEEQARSIQVTVYECPLPSCRTSALAVMFELRMPIEIRCYRDLVWLFINRLHVQTYQRMYEWLRVRPHASKLESYYTGPTNCKVKLVSSTNSLTELTDSSPPIATASVEDFLCENNLQVELSPIRYRSLEEERDWLTPKLNQPDYERLQYTISSTEFLQNQVIADLSVNQETMTPSAFVEFGSFRSGHRLQWWNLLALLELDSLSLNEESVVILIAHAILQQGPLHQCNDSCQFSWCTESHQTLLADHFVDELMISLNRRLDDCGSNWNNQFELLIITLITMRMFSICNETRIPLLLNIILKCRLIGEKWIDRIASLDFHHIENLREIVVTISITIILTFSTDTERFEHLLSSNGHMISLLKSMTNLNENCILCKESKKLSNFQNNLIRFCEIILQKIQPSISNFLRNTSYQSLDQFTVIYSSSLQRIRSTHGHWKKRNKDIYDGWYDGDYESNRISINCSVGIYLVNGMSIRYLPERIVKDPLYVRVFGNCVFQVLAADNKKIYLTKYTYHDENQVQYEFEFDDQLHRLFIYQWHTKTNERFQLIHPKCFENQLPIPLIEDYSHWKNVRNQIIEFRPVHFKDPDFLNNKSYLLNIETGLLTTNNNVQFQTLINSSSALFQYWFTKYFSRLDEQDHVYMMKDEQSNRVMIYMSRLDLAFQYDPNRNCLISREYSDLCINQDQWIGTLTGLKSGLLLSPIETRIHAGESFQYRKLIVSFGYVCAKHRTSIDHQLVTIQRKASMHHLRQYFVFTLNDRLRIIQPSESIAGWLYLALLHAQTSHPLPDQYTGLTGMERAFQLLNSSICWNDRPFDSISLNILHQIAAISPKAIYYQQMPVVMMKIDWNLHSIPYSLQHVGYYLIVKILIRASEKFNFMHPSSVHSDKMLDLLNDTDYDETLLTKFYWDYHPYFSPLAQLSTEIEEYLSIIHSSDYQPLTREILPKKNQEKIYEITELYRSGNVQLKDLPELSTFPLSKWLSDAFELKIIWIGLLKLALSIKSSNMDDKQRFELLLNFLSYNVHQSPRNQFYLRILKTTLKSSEFSLTTVSFPPFTQYHNIEQIAVTPAAIDFKISHSANERRLIVEEVRNCFDTDHIYKDQHRLASVDEKNQIKFLLKSWQLNRKLKNFLQTINLAVSTIEVVPFDEPAPYFQQHFSQNHIRIQYQIKVKSKRKSIDQQMLADAKNKYFNSNSNSFIKTKRIDSKTNLKEEFPVEIFSGNDDEKSHLINISTYFKNHLLESWTKMQSIPSYETTYCSLDELIETLQRFQRQSSQLWKELHDSITDGNQKLFDIGLLPRAIPTILICLTQEIWFNGEEQDSSTALLTKDQCTLVGGILVNWVLEQQIERALNFLSNAKQDEFKRELSNTPHTNWIPAEHLPWLIFELETNMTIREKQVDVARHMMQSPMSNDDDRTRNFVMQMNMGEGKTSVIVPMLALGLSSSSSTLVRVVILRSLLPTNYHSLKQKLGGLLNRRVFQFICRRDMDFNNKHIDLISTCLNQALQHRDILLVSPEDILSFDLLTIDKCRREQFEIARSMLVLQRWIKSFVRDILDESDEILHCKYQLVYTVGIQQDIDGGFERWKLIQWILETVKNVASDMAAKDPDEINYKPTKSKGSFPEFRLLSHRPFGDLSIIILNQWLQLSSYRKSDQQLISSFILEIHTSTDDLLDRFTPNDVKLFLVLRGLLSMELLYVALTKRYRVNYGVNAKSEFKRLMAVPFRAKDVPSERTEFGHPDMALLLTQLSYYYSGLNDFQLMQCFNRLIVNERDPESIYYDWISHEYEHEIPKAMKQLKGVNLNDQQKQINGLFSILRHNMSVINYFLNHFVFPLEAKQFPSKLVASAWDLSSDNRTNLVTGFSGTSDTQLLLPLHIQQNDLSQLHDTDGIVVNHLLQVENQQYQCLPKDLSTEVILTVLTNYQPMINVIVDVGALFVDRNNREVAEQWLKLTKKTKIDYAVYFESDRVFVCDRQFEHQPFLTSSANQRLDRCVFYLDEVHTRGTDFQFPIDFKSAVTLGNGLTKDRFVQACMRMRRLSKGHSLTFWSSIEVHRQILRLKVDAHHRQLNAVASNSLDSCDVKDILRWVYANSQQSIWDGLYYWATQSIYFERKKKAFSHINWAQLDHIFTDDSMRALALGCIEPEVIELWQMYGAAKIFQTISQIYLQHCTQSNSSKLDKMQALILERLTTYGGVKPRLSQSLDEEHQRELEQEIEQEEERVQEHQVTIIRHLEPCQPRLNDVIKRLTDPDNSIVNLSDFPTAFCPIPVAFTNSTFYELCQPSDWSSNIWISTEFQRVIETKNILLDPFLRPLRWIIYYRQQYIIALSPFEANWFMKQWNYHLNDHSCSPLPPTDTTLRLLIPRVKRNQSILVNKPSLIVPYNPTAISLPIESLVELFVFNGTVYFENTEEQSAYCELLGLCLKPRSKSEEEAFERGWITADGFVEKPEHRLQLRMINTRFSSSLSEFIKVLIKHRHHGHASSISHVGIMLYKGIKPLSSDEYLQKDSTLIDGCHS